MFVELSDFTHRFSGRCVYSKSNSLSLACVEQPLKVALRSVSSYSILCASRPTQSARAGRPVVYSARSNNSNKNNEGAITDPINSTHMPAVPQSIHASANYATTVAPCIRKVASRQ